MPATGSEPHQRNAAGLRRLLGQPDRLYAVDRTTNLVSNKIFVNLQSSISGRTGITSFKDTTAIGPGPYYYRVRLQQ